MPLTLTVGITKKHGLPNYGSIGASCHVEVELESSLLHGDLDGFHRHVRNAFLSCRQAVHDELDRHQQSEVSFSSMGPCNGTGPERKTCHSARPVS